MFFLQLIDWKSSLAAPRVHCPLIFGSFVRKYLLSSRRIFTIFSDGRIFEHIEPILGRTSRESSGLPAASYRLSHHQIFHHNISSSNISSSCVISAKNKIRMGTSWMGPIQWGGFVWILDFLQCLADLPLHTSPVSAQYGRHKCRPSFCGREMSKTCLATLYHDIL